MKKLIQIYNDKTHKIIKILGIKIKIRNKNYQVPKDFEKEFIKKNYNNIRSIDLLNKYKKLIKNLSPNDVSKINKILQAIILLIDNGDIDKNQYIDEVLPYKQSIKFNEECYLGYEKYFLPIDNFDNSIFYYKHGLNAIENPDKISNLDFIDAGAYIGDSALIFDEYTSGKIHSFEPMQREFNLLKKTIEMNEKQNIIPVNLGLSDKQKQIIVKNSDATRNFYGDRADEIIKLTTIDDYVEKNNIKVGLIKSDIEGAEQALLRGAEKTIKRDRPVLVMSIYHNTHDFFDIKELIESWNLGYKFKIEKNNTRILIDTMLICEVR